MPEQQTSGSIHKPQSRRHDSHHSRTLLDWQASAGLPLPGDPSLYKRWTLCQALLQRFWDRWSKEYLQHLQAVGKWTKKRPNLKVGDLVLMSDGSSFHTQWTLARVTAVYKGLDGLVRAVDVKNSTGQTYRRPVTKLSMLLTDEASQTDQTT